MADVRADEGVTVDELRTGRLSLVDRDGAVRATLGAAADGAIGLRLYDGEDRTRAALVVDGDGATTLELHDAAGEASCSLGVGAHGGPRLYLHGADRRGGVRGHVQISVDDHGCPVLSLHDRRGRPRALVSLEERSGMATISCVDGHGNPRAMMAEDLGGAPVRAVSTPTRTPGVPALVLGETEPAPTPAPPDRTVEQLTARMVRLERARRRHWVSAAALVLLGALAGSAASRLSPPAIPAPAVAAPTVAPAGAVVQAEEVVLTDRAGTVRARLGVLPDGTPLLWMSDPDGVSTIELSAVPRAGSVLRLSGGRSSITLAAPPNDLPSLGAYDADDVLFQAPSHVARFLPPDSWR
ncbi:MAG TPA: hypothetical protein VKU61_07720 [Candidatus Binatia bacterium]|nr:hypothetical protein [Candidatus Binatia bacterium]